MDKNKIFLLSLEIKELIKKKDTLEATKKLQATDLTEEEFAFFEQCMHSDWYDADKDKFHMNFSDNSEFLKLVKLIMSNVKSKK